MCAAHVLPARLQLKWAPVPAPYATVAVMQPLPVYQLAHCATSGMPAMQLEPRAQQRVWPAAQDSSQQAARMPAQRAVLGGLHQALRRVLARCVQRGHLLLRLPLPFARHVRLARTPLPRERPRPLLAWRARLVPSATRVQIAAFNVQLAACRQTLGSRHVPLVGLVHSVQCLGSPHALLAMPVSMRL